MRELYKLIGKQGQIDANGWVVNVQIADVRQSFGRVDVFAVGLHPNSGTGKWVSLDKVVVNEDS